jgi:hypothetical protein
MNVKKSTYSTTSYLNTRLLQVPSIITLIGTKKSSKQKRNTEKRKTRQALLLTILHPSCQRQSGRETPVSLVTDRVKDSGKGQL